MKAEPDDNLLQVRDTVKLLRTHLNETQEQFARRLGVTTRAVARYERSRPPKTEILARLKWIAVQEELTVYAAVFHDALTGRIGPPSADPRPEVEEPGATDPQFPHVIVQPDLEMSSYGRLSRIRPAKVVVCLHKLLSRICVCFQVSDEQEIIFEMSPGAAEELGEQLLYGRDKLTGRR